MSSTTQARKSCAYDSVSVSNGSSKIPKIGNVELPDIPHGIPKEILKKIFSYVVNAKDNGRLEQVNNTFAEFAWIGFTEFKLSDVPITKRDSIEEIKNWFGEMWKKATNLKVINVRKSGELPGCYIAEEASEFLMIIKRAERELHRAIHALEFPIGLHWRLYSSPVFPSLISDWRDSLKCFSVYLDPYHEHEGGKPYLKSTYGLTAKTLKNCYDVERVVIYVQDDDGENDDYGILDSVTDKICLKELTIYDCRTFKLFGIAQPKKEAIRCPGLWFLAEAILCVSSSVCGCSTSRQKFLARDGDSCSYLHDDFESVPDWSIIFTVLPNLALLKLNSGVLGHCEDFSGLVVKFLNHHAESATVRKLEGNICSPVSNLFGLFNQERDTHRVMSWVMECLDRVKKGAEVTGKLITENLDDFSSIETPIEKMYLKFVKESAECYVWCLNEGEDFFMDRRSGDT